MAALCSSRPVECIRFDATLEFIRLLRPDGGQEWTILRKTACLGAFDTLQEAIAGAWVALMITQQTDTANALWHWRAGVVRERRAA